MGGGSWAGEEGLMRFRIRTSFTQESWNLEDTQGPLRRIEKQLSRSRLTSWDALEEILPSAQLPASPADSSRGLSFESCHPSALRWAFGHVATFLISLFPYEQPTTPTPLSHPSRFIGSPR